MVSPTKENTNDANASSRLEFVKQTAIKTFGFQVAKVNTVAYQEGFPFPYNNFVFAVHVDRSASQNPPLSSKQPGSQPIPANESTFIFRLPNPVSGYNNKVRVQNEVAALSLAREALQPSLSHLVPRVYGWASAEHGQGWILQQHMSGDCLLDEFSSLSAQGKANILEQMADILACFQRFQLPSTIDKYGGIRFDESGKYVNTALSIFDAGPFETYPELLRATITSKLTQADSDTRVRGWRNNGIRARLDEFLDRGLPVLLQDVASLDKVLVHADFSIDNVLFDKSSGKLTALFDFDFGHISSVADEFLRSLGHGIGRFPSIRDEIAEELRLHNAMLHGFPQPLPQNTDEVDWTAAKAWDDAIKCRKLQRPATIPSMPVVSDIFWLSSQILPFKLCNEVVVGNSTEEQLARRKTEGEALLSKFLGDYEF